MSKFNRAYQVFVENGADQADRKQVAKSIAFVLGVSEANARVYLYKCIKKHTADGKAKEVVELAPISEAIKTFAKEKREKHRPVAKLDPVGNPAALRSQDINDGDYSCVPLFLKKSYERMGWN